MFIFLQRYNYKCDILKSMPFLSNIIVSITCPAIWFHGLYILHLSVEPTHMMFQSRVMFVLRNMYFILWNSDVSHLCPYKYFIFTLCSIFHVSFLVSYFCFDYPLFCLCLSGKHRYYVFYILYTKSLSFVLCSKPSSNVGDTSLRRGS